MILVVEDNEDLRELFRCVLECGGFSVATAASGAEGLACLRAAPQTRLVILDLALPDMTGLDVVGTLKVDCRLAEIPVLLVSGTPLARVVGLPMLVKPVGPEDLRIRSASPVVTLSFPPGRRAVRRCLEWRHRWSGRVASRNGGPAGRLQAYSRLVVGGTRGR